MTPEALARLHAAAFAEERPWTAAEFASLLSLPGALLLGDGRALLLARLAADEAEVLTLATDPAHRRQGLAAALLRGFHAEAAARGAARAFLEVASDNAPARRSTPPRATARTGARPLLPPRERPAADALLLSRPLP
jgi:ribosomal-protein-alanine N-acetyltransferase